MRTSRQLTTVMPTCFEGSLRSRSVLDQEVADADAVHHPDATALDADARRAQGLAHQRELTGLVSHVDLDVVHVLGR